MDKDDGGSAFPCSKSGCVGVASHRQGHQWLCPKHYRFGQMRASAKKYGKNCPSVEQLEALIHPEMQCADCNVVMNWLGSENQTFVASLQHYRNGAFGLVCRSCNTRHAFMPGDSYRSAPKDHKFCPRCGEIKPFSVFAADNSRSGPMKLKSWCKKCSSEAHREWRQSKTA